MNGMMRYGRPDPEEELESLAAAEEEAEAEAEAEAELERLLAHSKEGKRGVGDHFMARASRAVDSDFLAR